MISNCAECQFFDHHLNHTGDIVCAIVPHYAEMWQRLKTLDESTINAIPVDFCRDFELNPSLEKKDISLSLTFHQWQQVGRDSLSSKTILDFLKDRLIDQSLSLTLLEWQAIANASQDTKVLETLAQHNIEPEEEEEKWIEVNSSCISAIAFHRSSQRLTVRFNSGEIYEYHSVTSDTFQDFLDADSKGRFFNLYIKEEYTCNHIGFAFA